MKLVQQSLVSACALLLANVAVAEPLSLTTGPNDMRATAVTRSPDVPLANTHREPVTYSSALRHYAVQDRQAHVASSREYRLGVTADQLREGVRLRTTGPGAVVALSPRAVSKGRGLHPADLTIETPAGTRLTGADAMDQLVDQRAIQATGIPFSNGMVGFRLNRALGHGEFVLRAAKGAGDVDYQLHVLDAQGSAELMLTAPEQVLVGQSFAAEGRFDQPGDTLRSAQGFLLGPGGERVKADIAVDGNRYAVTAMAERATSFDQGLWELHVSTQSAGGIQRDVKTALAAAYPTARLDGGLERSSLRFTAGIEVASAGRYELTAVLMGTTSKGLTPVALSATAAWLEPGAAQLTLEFDAKSYDNVLVGAPFVLRDITLKDQSRMAVLERVQGSSAF